MIIILMSIILIIIIISVLLSSFAYLGHHVIHERCVTSDVLSGSSCARGAETEGSFCSV